MEKCTKWWSILGWLMLCLLAVPFLTAADSGSASQSSSRPATQRAEYAYAIQANLPKNQVDPQVHYWVLQLKPDQTQKLSTMIVNTGTKPITVRVQANNGTTANNASIAYNDTRSAITPKSATSFASLVVGAREQKIRLAPYETKNVEFTIKAPSKDFNGIILGGILTRAFVNSAAKGKLTLRQEVAYSISVVLQGKTMDVTPALTFGKQVVPKADGGRMVLSLPTTNDQPINIANMATAMTVTDKATGKRVYHATANGMKAAPHSQWNWALPVNHLGSGSYRMTLAVSGQGLKKETITRDFSVSSAVAAATTQPTTPMNANHDVIIVIVVLVVLLLVVVWTLLYFFAMDKGKAQRKRWETKRASRRGKHRRGNK